MSPSATPSVSATGEPRNLELWAPPPPIRLVLPIPPNGNHYKGVNKQTGRWYVTKEAKAYRVKVGWLARSQGVREMLYGRLDFSVWVYRARESGDADGFLKVLWDSLQGVAYVNDSQIKDGDFHVREDPQNPRVEITIKETACSARSK